MVCDTKLRQGQTITERKSEIMKVIETVVKGLLNGRIKAKVSAKGGFALEGLTAAERNDVTDACVYRRLMATGSPLVKQQLAKAEMFAGKKVQIHGAGHHSHDGGKTWHHNH